jgi:hypothetical protein
MRASILPRARGRAEETVSPLHVASVPGPRAGVLRDIIRHPRHDDADSALTVAVRKDVEAGRQDDATTFEHGARLINIKPSDAWHL